MKHLLLALLLIPTIAAGQNLPVGTAANAVRKDLGGSWTGRLFWLPATDTTTANNLMVSTYPSLNRAGSAIVQSGIVYIHNGTKWNQQVNSDLLAAWTAAITGNHYTKAQADARFQLQSNMGLYAKSVHLDSVMIQFAEFAGQTFATKEELPKVEAGRGVVIVPVEDTSWVMADTAVMMTAWRAQQTIARIDSTDIAQQGAISARLTFDEAEALYQPKGPYLTYEQDGSVTNELQTLMVSGNTLAISAGNTVTLPTNTGPQGPKGDTGATGSQGPQGIAGPTGATGAQGLKGDTGLTGAQGPQGIQGATGATGAKGDTGLQGVQGIAGPQGATGAVGPQGPIGLTGPQGPTGAKGDSGNTGAQGIQGPVGATGPSGIVTLTTTGTSGVATYSAGTLNIPNYTATGLSVVALPNVTVGETALITLTAGFRTVTVTCAGVLTGDRIQINPTNSVAGFSIGQAVASANNTLQVQVYAPLLGIGTNYSFTCKVAALR